MGLSGLFSLVGSEFLASGFPMCFDFAPVHGSINRGLSDGGCGAVTWYICVVVEYTRRSSSGYQCEQSSPGSGSDSDMLGHPIGGAG
jgi:hypothetical protein